MKQTSIKKNFIMNALLTMSSFIFPLITFPYVSRILSPEGTGKVSFANSVIAYFALFAQLGIPTYGIRACAKVRDNKEKLSRTVQEIFIINMVMTVITYIAFGITLACVPRLQTERPLFLIMSTTLLFNAVGLDWLYRGLEKYTYITVRSILFKFIALLAMFALIHQKSDYVIYGGISIFAASASNICNLVNVHRYIQIRPVGKYQFRRHLKPVMIFFAMSCATTIYTNLDTVMLGFIKTDIDVGYYNAAVKIKSVFIGGTTGGTLKELAPAEEEKTETRSLTFEGRCWKFGDDIDTDIIIPTQHLNYETMDEIKTHVFEPLRPDLAAKLREGDLIVAGSNFGCGSSREQAAEVLVANGVHCVIAKSFARIFFRNAINNGILLLECQDLADHVKEGDIIQVDLDNQKITADGKTYAIPAIPENLYHIIMDGGLVKSIMKKVEKGLL